MKTIWQAVLAIGLAVVVCLCYAPQAKSQLDAKAAAQKQIDDNQWLVITTNGVRHVGGLRKAENGVYVITKYGETFLQEPSIKKIKSVENNASTNSTRNGGDIQRNTRN